MSRRAIVLVSTALATLLILAEATQAQKPTKPAPTTGPKYSLVWMANDVDWSRPNSINKSGDVVGQACFDFEDCDADDVWRLDLEKPALDTYLDPPPPLWEAFICRPTGELSSVMNLNVIAGDAVPPYWRLLDAQGINDRGQIVGRAEYRSLECNADGQRYILQDWGVFLYTPADPDAQIDATVTIWSLGTRGVAYNEPTSISQGNADTIPVMLMSQEFDNGGHPCIFPIDGDPDVDVDLLPNPDNNRGVWKANAINTFEQVVGNARIGDFVNPVRYFPSIDPKPVSLGFLPKPGRTPWGWALDINESGSVTGCSTTSNGGAVHAFRYNTSTGMKDLGGLGTSNTIGYGINKFGNVVGDATTSYRAFVYTDTYGMVDLKPAIVNLPTELAQATMTAKKINDSGWIVGSFGVVDRGQAYLLKPVE